MSFMNPLYEIGLSRNPRRQTCSGFQMPQCTRSHIYIRSWGEHRFTTLDDLDEASLARLSADAFNSCAAGENSAANFQARLSTLSRPVD
jgi:hypothetical protein